MNRWPQSEDLGPEQWRTRNHAGMELVTPYVPMAPLVGWQKACRIAYIAAIFIPWLFAVLIYLAAYGVYVALLHILPYESAEWLQRCSSMDYQEAYEKEKKNALREWPRSEKR